MGARSFFDLGAHGFDLRLCFLTRSHERVVLFGRLVELVAGLAEPTDFFFHRLDLRAKLSHLGRMLVVA